MDMQTNILQITYKPEIVNGEAIFISSNALPFKASNYEPAGLSFHLAALKLSGYDRKEDTDTDDQSVKSDDKDQTYMPSAESYSTKSKKKGDDSKQQDHYALLGLGHLRFLATEEQIRKCYRETALRHHPDKQAALLLSETTEEAKQKKKDEIENHFKAVQEAYEILIDPTKRRIYDSTDEFDDDIPTTCAAEDFFKVFGPAFMRNGKWSVTQPVPTLGDEGTPLKEVDSFYDFWYTFKSWREFPHADEHDLEEAESRDEKRWMERQNAKLGEKARKEEHARVRNLIDNAYKKDPRIRGRKAAEKAEKMRKKEAKLMAKRMEEEEAVRAAEEERCRKEEDEKKAAEAAAIQKKQKEKEKKLLRKERSRLRTLSSNFVVKTSSAAGISVDDVENLCMLLNMENIKCLCDNIEGREENDRIKQLKNALREGNSYVATARVEHKSLNSNGNIGSGSNVNSVVETTSAKVNGNIAAVVETTSAKVNGNIAADVKQVNSLNSFETKEKPWAKEEVEMLRKGVQKYPKGTSRRWEVISEYIGTGRSVEEILKATKTVLLQKPDSAKAFESFLEKRKPVQTVASPLTTRDGSEILNGNGGIKVATEVSAKLSSISGTNGNIHTPVVEKVDVVSNGDSISNSDQDTWSAVEEKALVQALKTFPKDEVKRWERIAASIPGKSVGQCKKKFASMKENFKAKKNSD